ncbi:MAG: metalloregulator ArsR/SmtB family transcription factor [Rhodospirillales bacterium]|nr:metalloregulator ArsR/SmtB family transcription factor [Rhodospirillales bacterium]
MSNEMPPRTVFSQFALIGKAIGNGHRLELIDLLAQGERSVEELAGILRLSVANTSQHLQHLRRVGLVVGRKEGQRVYCSLADKAVIELLDSLRHIAESNMAEVQKIAEEHFTSRDSLEELSREELLTRIRNGQAMVIDVRPAVEFAAGHVAGAINFPMDNFEENLNKVPEDIEIVAYCRGPYCTLAYDAVELLRGKGYAARRLEDGFPQWKNAGFPSEAVLSPSQSGL